MAAVTSLRAAKQALRQQMKSALKAMTEAQKAEESRILIKKLLEMDVYQKSQSVSVYLTMPDEVNTDSLVKDIVSTNKRCYVPQFQDNRMDMLRVTSFDDVMSLPVYKWGIKQPAFDDVRENALDSEGLDLIIVPGLAFTEDGKRLGRGKGYYDGFLEKCKTKGFSPKTVALAYGVQRCSDVPTDTHDVIIDHVIFP